MDPQERSTEFNFLRFLNRKDFKDAFLILVLTQIALLLYIQFPRGYNFDEFHYIPAAKKILTFAEYPNYEHPPLAKFLIALGVKLLGDQPTGWRLMNAIFGAWTLTGLHVVARSLFQQRRTALFATLLTGFNMHFYVQSRIAMLDGFMVCFLVWGLVFLQSALKREQPGDARATTSFWAASGICFGLATASKWMGIVGWGAAGLWALWMMHSVHRQSSIPERLSAAFRLGVSLILVPIVAYFSTFLPFLFFHLQTPWTLLDFFKAQARMLDGQLRVVTQHPYHSDWKSWPWMTRPIWYVYDKEASKAGFVRGVIMLGNPAVMWPGLLAWLGCIGLAFKGPGRWRQVGAFVAGGWAILYFCWGIIPRKISFYYYYYPAALFLSLALAACFEAATDLGATRVQDTTLREIWKARIQILQAAYLLVVVGLFLHFLPILAAFRIPADSFRHWMWMRSWI